MRNLRPPMSSDEDDDDYDGFSFGNEFNKPKRETHNQGAPQWLIDHQKATDDLNRIVKCIQTGDLEGLKQQLREAKIGYDDYLKDGWTLMMHAVFNVQCHIISYLISAGADVNREADSLTPLMQACKLEADFHHNKDDILNLTKLLLNYGATVNVRDKTGYTPLMFACMTGNREIVDLLLNLSPIDAVDNYKKTPLHYAVENDRIDIVKMLIDAGASTEMYDCAGCRPRDVAISMGLTEIEKLFPEDDEEYILPQEATQYETFRDLVPSIFPDHKIAPYAQDIPGLLKGMRVSECARTFYEANISLAEFLAIDDNRLQSIGIKFEYQRKRILFGLLKFHGHEFSPKSVELVSAKQKNLYESFQMYAGYLKHLVMMDSALTYLKKMNSLKKVNKENISEMLEFVNAIKNDVVTMQKYIHQLSKTSTKNPLYIGPLERQNQRYKSLIRPFFKYTVIIGMGIFLSCKLIKLVC